MLDMKSNFKSKYSSSLTCRLCQVDDETLEHLLVCKKYVQELTTEQDFDSIWITGKDVPGVPKKVPLFDLM